MPPSVTCPNSRREPIHVIVTLLKVTGYRWAILPHNFRGVTISLRRRDFITALGAIGAAAAVSESTRYARQSPAARRIDVHHHFAAAACARRADGGKRRRQRSQRRDALPQRGVHLVARWRRARRHDAHRRNRQRGGARALLLRHGGRGESARDASARDTARR